MNHFVRSVRNKILLDQRLDAIGGGLAETKQADVRQRNADAVRAVTILDATKAFPLKNRGDGEQRAKDGQNRRNNEDNRNQRLPGWWKQPHEPVFQQNKNLVGCV